MSKAFFTPLEKVYPIRDLSLTGQTDKVGGKDINADGGLMPSSAHPVSPVRKKFSNGIREDSLTGFIVKDVFVIILLLFPFSLSAATTAVKGKSVVVTSQTLIADNKSHTALFEGSVVAKSEDIIIYSDKLEVFYNDFQGDITKIHAYGNVRIHRNERAIFSKEAIYLRQEEKIIFTGEPKVVDGENVISGSEIIYFIEDDRAIVKSSSVTLKNSQE